MPYKTGGGGFPELYDPENGQYSDEQKAHFLDDEISNAVMRYIFNVPGTYIPRYPIYGFHSDEYCELYVSYSIRRIHKEIPYQKIAYLLTPKEGGDKSIFFKRIGYEFDDDGVDLLYKEINNGSNFNKMKFSRLTQFGLFIKVPTKINNRKNSEYVDITTIWKYDENEQFNFITAIPKAMENKK